MMRSVRVRCSDAPGIMHASIDGIGGTSVHAPPCVSTLICTHSTERTAGSHYAGGFVDGVFLFACTLLQRHDFSGLAGNLGRLACNLGRHRYHLLRLDVTGRQVEGKLAVISKLNVFV